MVLAPSCTLHAQRRLTTLKFKVTSYSVTRFINLRRLEQLCDFRLDVKEIKDFIFHHLTSHDPSLSPPSHPPSCVCVFDEERFNSVFPVSGSGDEFSLTKISQWDFLKKRHSKCLFLPTCNMFTMVSLQGKRYFNKKL